VLPVSDSLLLAKMVDGIVVVADGAATPRQQVRAACVRLEYACGKILGLVLNKIKINSLDYHLYYPQQYYQPDEATQDEGEST
jgi:Mrp family chromosome partitioning ATPase